MLNVSKTEAESPNIIHFVKSGLLRASNISENDGDKIKPFVLILGSDSDTRFLFKTAFEIWNYDVAEAEELEQCFSISALKVPDLVFIDSEINSQESLSAVNTLRKHSSFKTCGFVFISGHAQEYIRQAALAAGADFYLIKPVDFNLLESFMQNYFHRKDSAIFYER